MRLLIQILLAIAGGCLVLGALQCLLSAIRRPTDPTPWHMRRDSFARHGEERP